MNKFFFAVMAILQLNFCIQAMDVSTPTSPRGEKDVFNLSLDELAEQFRGGTVKEKAPREKLRALLIKAKEDRSSRAKLDEYLNNNEQAVKEQDSNGNNALYEALILDDADSFGKMLALFKDDAADEISRLNKKGLSLYHTAAMLGSDNVFKFLMNNYPEDRAMTDRHNMTPLHYASQQGRDKIVSMLLEKKPVDACRPNKSNETPIMLAAQAGHFKIVESLFDYSKTCLDKNNTVDGNTIAHYLANGAPPAVIDLFKGKEKLFTQSNKKHETPLDIAIALQKQAITDEDKAYVADIIAAIEKITA